MNEIQLRVAMGMGFEVGGHTVTHISMPDAAVEVIVHELGASLAYLKDITGRKDVPFAYPYGRCNERDKRAVIGAGYSSAYLGGGLWGNGKGSDLFGLTRDVVRQDATLAQFASLVSGHTDVRRASLDLIRR